MRAYMIRNIETGEWFASYRKRYGRTEAKWTDKIAKGSLWQHKSGPIQAMRANHLDATIAEIVEFELKEIE